MKEKLGKVIICSSILNDNDVRKVFLNPEDYSNGFKIFQPLWLSQEELLNEYGDFIKDERNTREDN